MNTLTGLPLDLGKYLAAYLSPSSVAILQRTCSRTRQMTGQRLLVLSRTVSSVGEVMAYLRDQIVRASYFCIYLLPPGIQPNMLHSTLEIRQGQYYFTRVRDPEVVADPVLTYTTIIKENTLRRLLNTHLIDPTTLLMVLRRRLGCVRAHARSAGPYTKGNYGVDILRPYAKEVLRSLLEPLMNGDEWVHHILENDGMKLPIPLRFIPRPEHDRGVERLGDAVWSWLGHGMHTRVSEILTDIELAEALQATITQIVVGNVFALDLLRQRCSTVEPTTTQVLEYIQHLLISGKPVRVAFYAEVGESSMTRIHEEDVEYDPMNDEVTTRMYLLDMEDIECGTYTEHVSGFSTTHVRVSSGPETLKRFLRDRRLPGVIDPLMARTISRWVCRRKMDISVEDEWKRHSWEIWMLPIFTYLSEHLAQPSPPLTLDTSSQKIREMVERVYIAINVSRKLALYYMWCTGEVEPWYDAVSQLNDEEGKRSNVKCIEGIFSVYRQLVSRVE